MKYFSLFILLFSFKTQAFDKELNSLCKNVSALSNYNQLFSTNFWPTTQITPSGPIFSYLSATTSSTSVVMELCQIVIQFERLDNKQKILKTKDTLHKLTDKKYDEHFQQLNRTWDYSQSVYDFDNGEYRKGTLNSQAQHRRTYSFYKDSMDYYQRNYGRDPSIEERARREQEINQLSSITYKRAILDEAINCPEAKNDTNFKELYDRDISRWERDVSDYKNDADFYRNKLFLMGKDLSYNVSDLEKFMEELDRLSRSVTYDIVVKNRTEKTNKPSGSVDSDGNAEEQEYLISRPYQVFSAKIDRIPSKDFKRKWEKKWTQYVQNKFQNTSSFDNDSDTPVEEEFKNLSYECRPSKLMGSIDQTDPTYQRILEERKLQCFTQVRINQKKASSLFNYYVDQLMSSLYYIKENRSKIWSQESYHLGRHRLVESTNRQEMFQEERVSCSEKLEAKDMMVIRNRQRSVNNQYKEIIAENYMKKTLRMEEKAKAIKKQEEEDQKRIDFSKREKDNTDKDISNSATIPAQIKGGF